MASNHSAPTVASPAGPAQLPVSKRLLATAGAFGLLYMAGPGMLDDEGSWLLAVLALALWGRTASRPGRGAFAVEFLCAAVSWAGILSWAAFVWPGLLAWLGPGMAVYMGLQGVVLRRIERNSGGRVPLALAVPIVWILSEGVRATMFLPFGFEWMRLGTHMHHVEWASGSARVWGLGGLSWVLAALGGWVGDAVSHFLDDRPWGRSSHAWGLGPALVAALLTVAVPVPETKPGPLVLLVQPALEQERKMARVDPNDLFRDSVELTAEGLAGLSEQPDLVAWGESMLPATVMEPGLAEKVDAGLEQASWAFGRDLTGDDIRRLDAIQRNWVDVALFRPPSARPPGLFEPGTTFTTGAERFVEREGKLRRQGAILAWDGPGTPDQVAVKQHLVPGAETMLGLERIPAVRDTIQELAGYVPDLLPPSDEPLTMTLDGPSGAFRFGVSVCFDNAFDDVFTRPFEEGDVDFHLVVSNEAWFKQSQEADQMIAFSRLEALATGRSIARCANSGISCVIGPDGRVLERLEVGGRPKEVRGTLAVRVPVPADPGGRTPFVALEPVWVGAWILLPLLLLAAFGRRGRYPAAAPGTDPGARA